MKRLVIAVTCALVPFAAASRSLAKDLATINGKPAVTEDQYKKAVTRLGPRANMMLSSPGMKEQLLDHLLNSQVIAKKAKDAGLDKSKEFQDQLEDVKNQILAGIYMDKYVKDKATEKELKAYFEKNKEKFSKKEVKASHILIKDEKQAQTVFEEAKKPGANFEELAKKYSSDPGAEKGGDLGFFGHGQMVPEFEAAAFSGKKGEIYPSLVKSKFGYHIIKVTDIKGTDTADYATAKAEVEQRFKREVQESHVQELRKSAGVKVDEEALKALKI